MNKYDNYITMAKLINNDLNDKQIKAIKILYDKKDFDILFPYIIDNKCNVCVYIYKMRKFPIKDILKMIDIYDKMIAKDNKRFALIDIMIKYLKYYPDEFDIISNCIDFYNPFSNTYANYIANVFLLQFTKQEKLIISQSNKLKKIRFKRLSKINKLPDKQDKINFLLRC